MMAAIKHGLSNIFNVQGRDARQAFWYYVLFVYIVTVVLTMAVTIPMTVGVMISAVQSAQADQDPAAAQAAIVGAMSGTMPTIVWMGVATSVILLAFLAASFVRRLHDSDLPGYLALIPGGLQLANIALIPSQLGKIDEMMAAMQGSMGSADPMASFNMMQGTTGIGALLGWGAIALVIVFGARKSIEGPNRYGEEPFRA